MKVIFLLLICAFTLAGCNHKKSPEQEYKEYQYYESCGYKHERALGDYTKYCNEEFKKKFGYPYTPPGADLK